MNRLLELQKVSGHDPSAFSPIDATANIGPPSAAAAGNDDNNNGDGFTNLGGLRSTDARSDDGRNDDDGQAPTSISSADPPLAAAAEGGQGNEYVVQSNEELNSALELIEEIASGNREIQQLTVKLRNQSAENMKHFNPADEGGGSGSEKIEDIMQEVAMVSKKVKEKLEKLEEANKELCSDEERMHDNAAIVKIQQNQHAHLARCFLQYVQEYQEAVSENDRQLREQAVRRIKLKYTKADGSTVSDDEARQLASQVLELGRSDVLFEQSKEVLAEVLETRDEIRRIEMGMRQLQQLFNDLSALILEQDEVLDRIVENVDNSVAYVKSGREHLKKAKEHAESVSDKMKMLACCVGVLFIIILASVLGATIPVG